MPYKLDATSDFFQSIESIDTLIEFAEIEKNKENTNNRSLFLRLGVVTVVTKFQVFIENILKEFIFKLNNSGKQNKDLSIHFRLNNLKLYLKQINIEKKIENPNNYNANNLLEIQNYVNELQLYIDDNLVNINNFLNTKFPLGKTGKNELKDLFFQIEGKNIFDDASFDLNKMDEILRRRHDIIHEDKDMQLTELKLTEYKNFITNVVIFIDNYLFVNLS